MQRPPIPAFIRDLGADPGALRSLLVAAVSMGAAGLNPTVTSPGLPSIQSAIRAEPEINALIVGVTIAAAGLLFAGGFLADTDGRRGILVGALVVLVATSADRRADRLARPRGARPTDHGLGPPRRTERDRRHGRRRYRPKASPPRPPVRLSSRPTT